MAEHQYINHPSSLLEVQDSKEEGGHGGPTKELGPYMTLIKDSTKRVQGMIHLPNFNNGQCGYLVEKLEGLVKSANSFLGVLQTNHHRPCPLEDIARWVENFHLMLALAKQIKKFVKSCCKDEWIQAAMTLANMSQYISMLGFNVELCKIACEAFSQKCELHFNKLKEAERQRKPGEVLESVETCTLSLDQHGCGDLSSPSMESITFPTKVIFTLAKLGNIQKTEEEIVKLRATVDLNSLSKKLTNVLPSLEGEQSKLATYLLQRLSKDGPCTATYESGKNWAQYWITLLLESVSPLKKQLGTGASGSVYETKWLGMQVAMKKFIGSDNPEFLNEVEILAPLRHPNITSMFCCKKDASGCYIVMELMDADLHKFMHNRRFEKNIGSPFSISEAIDIMFQISEGVNYLHNNMIVHRDLKAKNILVKMKKDKLGGERVHVKVADFGVSKTKASATRFTSLQIVGTKRWMPPEVLKSTLKNQNNPLKSDDQPRYPFKCDTYSFAMVCFEILTGLEPFHEENNPKVMAKKIMGGARPKLPKCPPMLEALIKRCWRNEPNERPKFDFISSQLRFLKYLLMTGASKEAHLSAAEEFRAAANEAHKEEEAHRQKVIENLRIQKEINALSSLQRESLDVQSREHEALKVATAKEEAEKITATIKSREKDGLLALWELGTTHVGRPNNEDLIDVSQDQKLTCNYGMANALRDRIQRKDGLFHVAVCGISGGGKSSLINSFRGLRPRDKGAARVGITETTLEISCYPDPRGELPYSQFVWYDIPSSGSAAVPDEQYFHNHALFAFNFIIVVYSEPFTKIIYDIIENCFRYHIRMFIVRSKADQHIDNMIKDETDSTPGDNDYDMIYQEVKSKYVKATTSDFHMRMEVMAELAEVLKGKGSNSYMRNVEANLAELAEVLKGKPTIDWKNLLCQRVYMVSATNIWSLMQTGAKKGQGIEQSTIIDEAVLVEDLLKAARSGVYIKLRVPLCCEACARKMRNRLKKLEGVETVIYDIYEQIVLVGGNAKPEVVLNRARLIKRRTELVLQK